MVNDTTTLNGALRELGETMAANLTTQGVASTWDEGLTTLAGKILDIQGGGTGFDGISLSGDKSILSAADSEYVTLTAQLLDGQSSAAVEGETVSFKVYKSSDDSLVTTLTDDTDSSGVATVSYYGQGAGDLYIKAECIFVSESYEVEDCTYYSTTQYSTTSTTLNIPLPSHFSLEYIMKQTNSQASVPYLDIGDSTNNRMLVGQYARAGTNGLITYTGTSTNYAYGTNPTLNQDNMVHFIYDGSNYNYWLNDGTVMTISDKGITLSKLIHVESGSGGYLKNIKIKPL